MTFRTMPYRLAAAAIDRDHDWLAVYSNPFVLDAIADATEQGAHIVIEYRGDPISPRSHCDARILPACNDRAFLAERFAAALVHRADYSVSQLAEMIDGDRERSRAYLVEQVRIMARVLRRAAA